MRVNRGRREAPRGSANVTYRSDDRVKEKIEAYIRRIGKQPEPEVSSHDDRFFILNNHQFVQAKEILGDHNVSDTKSSFSSPSSIIEVSGVSLRKLNENESVLRIRTIETCPACKQPFRTELYFSESIVLCGCTHKNREAFERVKETHIATST